MRAPPVEEAEADTQRDAMLASISDAWSTYCRAVLEHGSTDAVAVLAPREASSLQLLYLPRLPSLCTRLGEVLGELLHDGHAARVLGSDVFDELAVAVATRSSALRADLNATRPMKKKALTDLLKALVSVGVSPLRSAVPPSEREPTAWFALASVDAAPALAPASSPWESAPALASWAKADAYYFRNMARVQVRRVRLVVVLPCIFSPVHVLTWCAGNVASERRRLSC